MNTYQIKFSVNGRETEQIVRANSEGEARKLIQMQYQGQRICFKVTKRL